MKDFVITAYLCMPYRGANGNMATKEDIAENVLKASQIASVIQSMFPKHLKVYVPHLDAELQALEVRDNDGKITNSCTILDKCLVRLSKCDMLIHCGDISSGMALEIDFARPIMPVVDFPLDYTDGDFEQIVLAMFRAWKELV